MDLNSTGASGYIGGDVLHLLLKSHPEYKVHALVRDTSKGAAITEAFQQVKIVNGGLDDTDIIAQEAKEADIVIHLAATGHLASVQTIYEALANKPKGAKSPYYIQISGASALAAGELADKTRVFGSGSDVIYNDLSGIDSIKSFIKQYPSRAVDNYIISVKEQDSPVKTALVIPPIIFGKGRGPGNQRSMQIPDLANATLKRQRGLRVGSGESRWGNIHIQDLSRLFLRLVEKAAEGDQDDNIWGANGVFFTGVGETSFGDISRRVAIAANDFNLIPSNEVDEVDVEEFDRLIPRGSVLLGTNARAGADRAKATLDWEPEMNSLEELIPQAVIDEARALGMKEPAMQRSKVKAPEPLEALASVASQKGLKGESIMPQFMPCECAEAHAIENLPMPSRWVVAIDATPDRSMTLNSRKWWEDHGPWLEAHKAGLGLSPAKWEMREEAMKQDGTVPDDEGNDDLDFICLPIPPSEREEGDGESVDSSLVDEEEEGGDKDKDGEEEGGDKKPYRKLASLHPDWPFYFTMRAKDRMNWWLCEALKRNQDDFDLHIYNDFNAYGMHELMENIFLQFNSVFKAKASYRDFWPEVEGLALILLGDIVRYEMCDDPKKCESISEMVGYLTLATIDALKKQGVFKPDSEIKNLGLVLFMLVRWGREQIAYEFSEECCSWIYKVIDLAEEADIELTLPNNFDRHYDEIVDKRDKRAKDMSRWNNVNWGTKLKAYGNEHGDGPTRIGGQNYDITKMPKAQRDRHSFK
ncbi:hypothetical protein NW768_011931 [Fusarium equiseti]|uniref:NAD-dependent epimerase/dehydratase domain-containing protein n=1 Tax=Fusarium equiseti TaxID=61235 RepID=A0ABQ8QWM2_FUSEQ|nr:hypothetical protein NW768_011931 [Fusarium equiseti]